jgi:hypothetical protein
VNRLAPGENCDNPGHGHPKEDRPKPETPATDSKEIFIS